ncbi:MAG: hypothetical protein OCC49_01680 [Fibrobacterales bacterium]
MRQQTLKILHICILGIFLQPLLVFAVTVEDLNPNDLLREQLVELNSGLPPEAAHYFFVDHYITPSAQSIPLSTPYGEINGYPFKQQIGAAALDTIKKRSWHMGFNYLYARRGWSKKDFLIYSEYENHTEAYSSHMFGFIYTRSKQHFLFNSGAVYQNNVEKSQTLTKHHPSRFLGYSSVHYRGAYATCAYRTSIEQCHVEIQLHQRPFRGTGFHQYLPDLSFSYENQGTPSFLYSLDQHLYDNKLYATLSASHNDPWFSSGLLTWYFDKGRFLKAELSSFLDSNENLQLGGELTILFARLAYNHPKEYRSFMGATQRFAFEIVFHLSSINGPVAPRAIDHSEMTQTTTESQ